MKRSNFLNEGAPGAIPHMAHC